VSGKKPPTASDRKMSLRHAKESVDYNMSHAKDHMKAAKKAKKYLAKIRSLKVPG